MPKVSVIIPSYNHEKYIGEAIRSILEQTFQDFEIIVVDDGSTDNSVRVIQSYKDPRIRLFCFSENLGACVAANKAIQESNGEYIALLNSDDLFLAEKLEKQVFFLDSHPEYGSVFSYAQLIDDQGNDYPDSHMYQDVFRQPNRTRHEWLHYFFYQRNCLCHPSILIRKKCYETIGYYNECLAQLPDFDLWIRLCQKYEIYIISESLVKFRIHNNEENVSGFNTANLIRLPWELSRVLKNYLRLNIEDFHKVFPNSETKENDSELIPYLVAKLAMDVDVVAYRSFSLQTLYDLLCNIDIAKKIDDKYGFKMIDFIKMTAQYDIYKQGMAVLSDQNDLRAKLRKKIAGRRVLIWGGGIGGNKIQSYLAQFNIHADGFIDINPEKWGKSLNNIPIYSPQLLNGTHERFYIFIGSTSVQQIEEQLGQFGYQWLDDYFPPLINLK